MATTGVTKTSVGPRKGGLQASASSSPRVQHALESSRAKGLLGGSGSIKVSARLDADLLAAAKAKIGARTDTELLTAALAIVAGGDDSAHGW